jgi:hypothetical protein
LLILISKSWGCPPPGPGMPFPRFFSLYDAIRGWMTRQMDGKIHEKRPRHPLLYVILVNVNGKPTLCKRTPPFFHSWMLTHTNRPLPLG